jgi:hypothetical protein
MRLMLNMKSQTFSLPPPPPPPPPQKKKKEEKERKGKEKRNKQIGSRKVIDFVANALNHNF